MTNTKQSKESKIKELETRLEEMQGFLEQVSKCNQEMVEKAEEEFLNSPTYNQLRQDLEFWKALNKQNEYYLAREKKFVKRSDENIRQLYDDNKRICENEGNIEYWIGITANLHDAREYERMREEICELQGKVEQQEQALVDRDAEINRLQEIIAENEIKFQLSISQRRILQLESEIEQLKSSSAAASSEPTVDLTVNEMLQIIERNIEQSKKIKSTKKPGRPPKVDDYKAELIIELNKNGYSMRNIAEQLNISVGTVHGIIKKNKTK